MPLNGYHVFFDRLRVLEFVIVTYDLWKYMLSSFNA